MEEGPWSALIASVAPIWGQIFDDCFALGNLVGRFFSEEQILNLSDQIGADLQSNKSDRSTTKKFFKRLDTEIRNVLTEHHALRIFKLQNVTKEQASNKNLK